MDDAQQPLTDDLPRHDATAEADPEAAGRRRWFRTNAFLAFTGGVLVVVGNFFLGLIAVVLLAGDRTRDSDSRAGGAVLIFAWMFTWTLPGASPYASFALLGIATTFLARSAQRRRSGAAQGGWRSPAALGALAAALGVLALVPHGIRASSFDADEAAERVLSARQEGTDRPVRRSDFAVFGALAFQDDFRPITASQRLAVPARLRFTNTPIFYVVLFEQSSARPLTGDGEPCFASSETLSVHGLSGEVVNLGRQDALEENGGCLPLLRGTRADLEPIAATGS